MVDQVLQVQGVAPQGPRGHLAVQDGANYSRTGNTITPAVDFNGTLTVPVIVNDGAADSAAFDVSVTVTASNDAPVITAQVALSTVEETALSITLADLTVGHETVLTSLGAGGLTVAAGGMSFAGGFTPKLTVAQGESLFVQQTAASEWIVVGGTVT